MIAQGDHVRPRVEDRLRLAGEDADAGGVFPVYHGEMDILKALELPQMAAQIINTRLGADIPHGENLDDWHGNSPFS
ncbi:hypothetical protein SDC9_62916 [bioreactor metagenome]|uniref:Uncharacterized protein n=1 Tax=bioreactor metagenome TaxID=1076179 RepID=A0A644XK33_9ZZZZ